MDKAHTILPENKSDLFDVAIKTVASGTPLREALDFIISAQNGALICIGDVKNILNLGNGGFRIDMPFTPQRLFELSKMDGAIVLNSDVSQIVCANFHLNPDPSSVTFETGMRHRSASRTSSQTEAIVIAISKRRTQTTIYRNGQGITLEGDEILFSKGNQGILALQHAKNTLERSVMRQSLIELDDLITIADVINLLTRYTNLINLAGETERFINFLGKNSGLLRQQLEEIMHGVTDAFLFTIRDYATSSSERDAKRIARALLLLPREEQSPQNVMALLGFEGEIADEDRLQARGFRVISRISVLDEAATAKIIEEYGSLSAIVSDSKDGFDRLSNIDLDNVRAIAKSFMQLRNTL
ncbi:MAG: DNA integrity scanning diadenylate cyclase DisA [Coriobacteriales bacterium]|jgi:diadenylate cyclase|nr:DNA integrity scanning diadenylate cyclase DisA [Coriobacteriales bacterium]